MEPLGNPPPADKKTDEADRRKLRFEYYKARLEYRKFVLGSVFVAIAIAAIPPLFQLATAVLEFVKTSQQLQIDKANRDADRQTKQQEFREDYIKNFLSNALSQDIELRIRFAQYFSHVSGGAYKDDWIKYHKALVDHRDEVRRKIDGMEKGWRQIARTKEQDEVEIDRIERNLAWAYKEVGYVERNRSVAINPRAPEARPAAAPASALTADTLSQAFEQLRGRREDLQALLEAAAEFGINDQNDVAIFMAAVLQQTKYLTVETESLDFDARELMDIWPTRFPNLDSASRFEHKPQELGNFVYGTRMGNKEPGDGYKYRGRGYIQITGRDNYRLVGQQLGLGSLLEDDPDRLLKDRKLNARAAAQFYARATARIRSAGRLNLRAAWMALLGGQTGVAEGTEIYDRLMRGSG
jgi:predicted chitinase